MKRQGDVWRVALGALAVAVVFGVGWIGLRAFAWGWGPGVMGGWGQGSGSMGRWGPGAGMMGAGSGGMMGGARAGGMMGGWAAGMMGGYQEEQVPASTPDPTAERVPINVTLKEWQLTPGRIEAQVGQLLSITITNTGAIPHRFAIPDLGLSVGPIAPGETRTVEVAADKAGTFAVLCDVPGHREAGQRGTLFVRTE